MKIRMLSLMLALSMCLTLFPVSVFAADDSAADSTLADTLFDMTRHTAYIRGNDGYVYPEDPITRAEICSIFYSLMTEDALLQWESSENDFPDTDPDSWYNTMVSTLVNVGLFAGRPDGTFGPGDNLTRAEFATLLCRLCGGETETGDVTFSDIEGHWAKNEILAAAAQGLFEGDPDGSFRPNDSVTRAEAITVINRMLGRGGQEITHLQRGMTTFYDNLDTTAWYYCEIQEAATSHEYVLDDSGAEYWKPLENAADAPSPYRYVSILHAGGTVDGKTGTNSLEAMNISYILNAQYLEVDFRWSSDDQLVCLNDWNVRYSSSIEDHVPLSLSEFKQIRILDEYTPMTLDLLIDWLKDHPGVRIITDVKEDNIEGLTLLAQTYPDMMDRFIPQIYYYSEYDAVAELGFQDIILTLYHMTWAEKTNASEVAEFAKAHKLWAITFGAELADTMPESYIATLKSAGTQLLIHTVNDESEITNYLQMGIDGIYRDY